MPGEIFNFIGRLFGGSPPPPPPAPQPVQFNFTPPPTPEDPAIERERLAAVAAAQRAKGRDSTIYTDPDTETRMPGLRKENLGT